MSSEFCPFGVSCLRVLVRSILVQELKCSTHTSDSTVIPFLFYRPMCQTSPYSYHSDGFEHELPTRPQNNIPGIMEDHHCGHTASFIQLPSFSFLRRMCHQSRGKTSKTMGFLLTPDTEKFMGVSHKHPCGSHPFNESSG